MISSERLRVLAREDEVPAGLAEKNYVNSWVLYGIYESRLGGALVFKGGTALSKLYFPRVWRFSEDLDFTAVEGIEPLEDTLREALDITEEASGISFDLSSIHEAGDPIEYVQVKVQYDAILGQRNTTTVDITMNEPLTFPVVKREHSVEDIPAFVISAYSIEEILVEKLRSLFQRGRARDYHDLYYLLTMEHFDDCEILRALVKKSQHIDITPDLEGGIPEAEVDDIRRYWQTRLDRLVQEKPDFDEALARINSYLVSLSELHDHSAR